MRLGKFESFLGVLALLPSMAVAQEAELHVVVRCSPHRLLGETFRKSLRDQLGDALAPAFAGAATVRVFVYNSERPTDRLPAWDAAFRLGLERLDRVERFDPIKTHFISVDIADGTYRVRSRQLDGRLGWTSPVVRDERAADRGGVARLILQQIVTDYGLAAAVVKSDGDKSATISFPGCNLSDDRLREWVRPGDVFTILQTGGGRALPVQYAYFVVSRPAENGAVSGKIESRFVKPLAGWENGNFRLVKLGAGNAQVRMRIVGPDGTTPVDVTVKLSATGFGKNDPIREQGPARGGRFNSAERYDRLAYATFSLGERVLTYVPIAVMNSEPVTIEVRTDPGGEAAAAGEADGRALRSRLHDVLNTVAEETTEIRTLMNAGKNRPALTRVSDLLRRLDEDIPRLAGDAAVLRTRTPAASASLDEVDRGLRDLKQQESVLRSAKLKLEQAVEASGTNDSTQRQKAMQALVARAEQEAQDADYEKAIATYEDAIKQAGDWPEIRKRLDALNAGWAIKSEAHREARRFIYNEWSKAANLEDVEKLMDRAASAWATCRDAGDKLTPRKLHHGLVRAAGWVARRDEDLRRAEGDDAAKQAANLRRLSGQIRRMLDEIERFVNAKQS